MKAISGASVILLVLLLLSGSSQGQTITSASKTNHDRKGVMANVQVTYVVRRFSKEEVHFAVAEKITINPMGGYNYDGVVYRSEVPGLMDVLMKTSGNYPTIIFDIYYNNVKQATKEFSISASNNLGMITGDGFSFRTSEAAAKNPSGWKLIARSLEAFNYSPDPTIWLNAESAIRAYLEEREQRKRYNAKIQEADAAYAAVQTEMDIRDAMSLYHEALRILPQDAYSQRQIDQLTSNMARLREKEKREREEEEKRKAEERKREEAARVAKEAEERELAAQQKRTKEEKEEGEAKLASAAVEQQRAEEAEREAEKRAAEERAAALAEAERVQQKEAAERWERQEEERRREEQESDDRALRTAGIIGRVAEDKLRYEWIIAKAAWNENRPSQAEQTKRYDRATALMADARLKEGAELDIVIEAIHLHPHHPDVRKWVIEGGSKASWGYLSTNIDRRYKEMQESYKQSLSYQDQQTIARAQIQHMSKTFQAMASLEHDFRDPEALLESVNRRMNLISQQRDEATQFHLNNLNDKLSKNATLQRYDASQSERTVAVVAEGLTSALDIINSSSEAKRAREHLEYEKRNQMESIRDGLLEDTSNGIAALKKSFFNTNDPDTEKEALNRYYHITCYDQQIRSKFNYNSTSWYDNFCPVNEGRKFYKNLKPLLSTSEPLNVADRKAYLFSATKIEAFREGALFRLGEVVKANPDDRNHLFYSYDIYQRLSTNEIEKIQYQFAKHSVMPGREIDEFAKSENRLKMILQQCVQKGDAQIFSAIVDKKLHRQIGPHFSDVTIPAIIRTDQSRLLSLLLEKDEDAARQEFKDGLLIEALAADASTAVGVLVKKGADINQKLQNKSGQQIPLILLFAGTKTATRTNLVSRATDFNVANALLVNNGEKEKFYTAMLQTAIEHDNVFALKAVSAHARPLLLQASNKGNLLFEHAVQHNSARVLDSLFRYSENDRDKNYLVFQSSELNVYLVLKRMGLDLDYKNDQGMTALHKAVEENNLMALTNLVKAGADGSVLNNKGFSPVHFAVYSRNRPALEVLVESDTRAVAKPDKNYGWTPLHFAARENFPEGCNILIQNGADKNARDKWGRTPGKIARERYFVSLKDVLK